MSNSTVSHALALAGFAWVALRDDLSGKEYVLPGAVPIVKTVYVLHVETFKHTVY